MSFRKRSEIIGTPSVPGRGPAPVSRPINLTGRAPPAVRSIPNRGSPSQTTEQDDLNKILKNPAVRPSLITSQPTVSTGGSDLDKLLLHQGLPTGNSLLIQESGTTDFSAVLLRSFASQGVIQNRVVKDQLNCHVIAVGVSLQWANDLPGLYKGSTKEQKKAKIMAHESKVSVSNLTNSGASAARNEDLKIAWRYGLNKKNQAQENESGSYEHYNNQFDITQKLVPGPSSQDISFVPVSTNFAQIIQQISMIIERQLKQSPSKIIRITLPGLLNPSIYSPICSMPSFITPFIHSLRSILRKYDNNVVLLASIPLDLYPRDSSVTCTLESLFDSVIHLQPFNQEMMQLIEKAYKNEPAKIQQGLINIIKLPVLSERGLMMIHDGEYAFKNGRKKFEIEEWGIPVEDDSKDDEHNHEGAQTTKNIEF